MLSLCNYDVVTALQAMNNVYFCIVTLQLYHSLICLWSVLKEIIVCVFFCLFLLHSNQRGLCAFLIILICIYGSLLLLATVIFIWRWFIPVVCQILRYKPTHNPTNTRRYNQLHASDSQPSSDRHIRRQKVEFYG